MCEIHTNPKLELKIILDTNFLGNLSVIQLFGANHFVNSLFANSIEQEIMQNSHLFLSRSFQDERLQSYPRCLTLVEFGEIGSWEKTKSCCNKSCYECVYALFNVNPDCGIENDVIRLGIRGIFYTDDSLESIYKGIGQVFQGGLWFKRKVLFECILNNHSSLEKPEVKSNKHSADKLTKREKTILQYLKQGASNQEIADKMFVSINTVKSHLYKLYKKIKVPNRFQAILWASNNKI